MDRLVNAAELLDGPLDDLSALAGNLRDLRRVNRLLGGARLSIRALERLIEHGEEVAHRGVRVLDIGTGAGDIPLAMVSWARRARVSCHVTALDRRPEVIRAARRVSPELELNPDLDLVTGDGLGLPYGDEAFDVGHTSLVIHHLEPLEAVALLTELGRVSRRGVILNDLRRGRAQWLGAWLLSHIATTNRLTRHDAPLSVRRAYTLPELRDLLASAGLRPIAEIGGLFGHRVAIAAVRDREPGLGLSLGAARVTPPGSLGATVELEEPS